MKQRETFTLDEIATLTGLSRRTVRYYIQEGLVDRPSGHGRGATYTREHLEQLLHVQKWQSRGVSLQQIRALRDPDTELAALATPRRAGTVEVWSHIVVREGIELNIEPGQAGLSPEQVRRLASRVTRLVEEIQEEEP